MAAQGLSLTAQFEEFAAPLVKSGRFADADEVLHAAMDALQREEAEDEAKLVALRAAIDEGEASGIYEGNPFDDIRAKYGWPPRVRA